MTPSPKTLRYWATLADLRADQAHRKGLFHTSLELRQEAREHRLKAIEAEKATR